MFSKKRTKGIDLINEVTDRFSKMINELDEGVDDCQKERTDVLLQIESLKERDAVLGKSVLHASGVASKLRFIIDE